MGTLDEVMAIDAEAFVDTDAFGESVTYTRSAKNGGTTRTIKAVIDRNPPEKISATITTGNKKMYVVVVRNDSTYGISSSQIDLGGDTLTFAAEKIGGDDVTIIIKKIRHQDAAMLTLEL